MNTDTDLIKIRPSERQLKYQEGEFYAFFHFGVNTYTDREWGDGTESESIFRPEAFDASQWIKTIKKAGMTGAILTCKHHDGFCLWPSRFTEHSVKNSPVNVDVVSEVSKACEREGIKFGIYLSPWDRNSKVYGTGVPYDDYYLSQLKELLTDYGKIFCVWLDGACGEGPGGRPQKYDWNRYYACIREYQPEACINVCGPDIRWCGNEAGDTRKSEWSVVPAELKDAEKVADKSQKSDDSGFREKRISSEEQDLGSRERLKNEQDLIWYPAEVNTSIRPGWFYHEKEDDAVKPLAELISIYEKSVGGNATFLLNIPPNKDGLICEADSRRLEELGEYIRKKYGNDLMAEARMITDGNCEESNDCLVKTKDYSKLPSVFLEWNEEKSISRVVILENIRYSQRIERFEIWAGQETEAVKIYSGTTVGYKKIAAFDTVKTRNICIKITDTRVSVCIKGISIYE